MSRPDDDEELLGVDAAHAARILALTMHQLAGWDSNGLVRPEVRAVVGARVRRLYSFGQLLELGIVRELADRNVAIGTIRQLVDRYRSFATHPLRELRWAVSGGHVLVHDGRGWMGGRLPGQGVIEEVIDLEELRVQLRRRVTERPSELHGAIERRDRVHRRQPVFAGTRTPVAAVQTYIRRNFTDSEILEAYPHLTIADIDFARSSLQAS